MEVFNSLPAPCLFDALPSFIFLSPPLPAHIIQRLNSTQIAQATHQHNNNNEFLSPPSSSPEESPNTSLPTTSSHLSSPSSFVWMPYFLNRSFRRWLSMSSATTPSEWFERIHIDDVENQPIIGMNINTDQPSHTHSSETDTHILTSPLSWRMEFRIKQHSSSSSSSSHQQYFLLKLYANPFFDANSVILGYIGSCVPSRVSPGARSLRLIRPLSMQVHTTTDLYVSPPPFPTRRHSLSLLVQPYNKKKNNKSRELDVLEVKSAGLLLRETSDPTASSHSELLSPPTSLFTKTRSLPNTSNNSPNVVSQPNSATPHDSPVVTNSSHSSISTLPQSLPLDNNLLPIYLSDINASSISDGLTHFSPQLPTLPTVPPSPLCSPSNTSVIPILPPSTSTHLNSLFADFFECVPDLLVVLSGSCIIECNKSWVEALGWSQDELKKMSIKDVCNNDDFDNMMKVLQGKGDSGSVSTASFHSFTFSSATSPLHTPTSTSSTPAPVESSPSPSETLTPRSISPSATPISPSDSSYLFLMRLITKSNTYLPVAWRCCWSTSISSSSSSSTASYLYCLSRPLTNEQNTLLSSAMADVERLKAEFLANISHELQTPLSGITTATTLLNQTELSGEQSDFLSCIHVSSEHLRTIIGDILSFADVERGSLHFDMKPMHINLCIEECISMCFRSQLHDHLKILHSVAWNLPPVVVTDVSRIRQILANLLANSLKFTEQGEIVIRVTKFDGSESPLALAQKQHLMQQQDANSPDANTIIVQPPSQLPSLFNSASPVANQSASVAHVHSNLTDIHAEVPAGSVILQFAISDTGLGISPSLSSRIFQIFTQADSSSTKLHSGVGVGLITSLKLVRLFGGEMWYATRPGEGTTFYFTIPCGLPKPASKHVTPVQRVRSLMSEEPNMKKSFIDTPQPTLSPHHSNHSPSYTGIVSPHSSPTVLPRFLPAFQNVYVVDESSSSRSILSSNLSHCGAVVHTFPSCQEALWSYQQRQFEADVDLWIIDVQADKQKQSIKQSSHPSSFLERKESLDKYEKINDGTQLLEEVLKLKALRHGNTNEWELRAIFLVPSYGLPSNISSPSSPSASRHLRLIEIHKPIKDASLYDAIRQLSGEITLKSKYRKRLTHGANTVTDTPPSDVSPLSDFTKLSGLSNMSIESHVSPDVSSSTQTDADVLNLNQDISRPSSSQADHSTSESDAFHPSASHSQSSTATRPSINLKRPVLKNLGQKFPLNILLVEDNLVNSKLGLKMLSKLGYEADWALNGQEGLEKIRQKYDLEGSTYDLVFLDLNMPVLNGWSAAQSIMQSFGCCSLPGDHRQCIHHVSQPDMESTWYSNPNKPALNSFVHSPRLGTRKVSMVNTFGFNKPEFVPQVTPASGEYSPGCPRPVLVALTANTTEEDRRRCFEIGFDEFIAKPINVHLIESVLRRWGRSIQGELPDIMRADTQPLSTFQSSSTLSDDSHDSASAPSSALPAFTRVTSHPSSRRSPIEAMRTLRTLDSQASAAEEREKEREKEIREGRTGNIGHIHRHRKHISFERTLPPADALSLSINVCSSNSPITASPSHSPGVTSAASINNPPTTSVDLYAPSVTRVSSLNSTIINAPSAAAPIPLFRSVQMSSRHLPQSSRSHIGHLSPHLHRSPLSVDLYVRSSSVEFGSLASAMSVSPTCTPPSPSPSHQPHARAHEQQQPAAVQPTPAPAVITPTTTTQQLVMQHAQSLHTTTTTSNTSHTQSSQHQTSTNNDTQLYNT